MAIGKYPLPIDAHDEAAERLKGVNALDYDLDFDEALDSEPASAFEILTTEDLDGPGRGGD